MYFLFHFLLFVDISQIQCQQVKEEWLAISTQKPGEKVNIKNLNIARRFIEDLDEDEWRVAHLRTSILDGRRACASDTFEDVVKRYRRMLKEDASRVNFVSADPLPVDPEDLREEPCEIKDDFAELMKTSQFTSTTPAPPNVTSANTTDTVKEAETTPKLDFKATTVENKEKSKKKKKSEGRMNNTRRGSEYMFSSVEYYDESVEFDANMCPDAVDIITLQLDQLRSYDLECEMIVEWRSLE